MNGFYGPDLGIHRGLIEIKNLEELQDAEEYDNLYRDDDEIERADRALFRSGSIDQYQSPNFLNYSPNFI